MGRLGGTEDLLALMPPLCRATPLGEGGPGGPRCVLAVDRVPEFDGARQYPHGSQGKRSGASSGVDAARRLDPRWPAGTPPLRESDLLQPGAHGTAIARRAHSHHGRRLVQPGEGSVSAGPSVRRGEHLRLSRSPRVPALSAGGGASLPRAARGVRRLTLIELLLTPAIEPLSSCS